MIKTSLVSYEGDSTRMLGFLARDDARSGQRPTVLVAPEAPGLEDYNRELCRRMAAGYVALALDFHGEGSVLTDRADMMRRLQGFLAEPLRIRALRGDRLLFRRHRLLSNSRVLAPISRRCWRFTPG